MNNLQSNNECLPPPGYSLDVHNLLFPGDDHPATNDINLFPAHDYPAKELHVVTLPPLCDKISNIPQAECSKSYDVKQSQLTVDLPPKYYKESKKSDQGLRQ